jgi:tetratricopeptide (TPR) repeat protein/TolB-like protein
MVAVVTVLLSVHPATRLSAQCPDGSPPPCQRDFTTGRVAIDPNAVAILPFRVSGPPEAQYLREGMVDLLNIALDGVAGWRIVHPRTVLNTARAGTDLADPANATRLARAVGAGSVIIGSAVAVGPELRVQAELYDATGGQRLTAVRARGDLARPAPMVDSIVGGLAKQRLLAHTGAVRHALQEYTTTSPAALQAYLAAEQLARKAEWQEALDSLQSAIARDSTFGLAYYRLYLVRFYGGNLGGFPVADVRRAMEHLDRLPPRQRDLLLLAYAQLTGLRAEALNRAEEVEARYPDDAEAQMEVGETYFHQGLLADMPPQRAVQPLERALQLDSSFIEPYLHNVELLCLSGDTARAWARLDAGERMAPSYRNLRSLAQAMRIALRGEDPARLPRSDLGGLVAHEILRVLDHNPGRAVALADSFMAPLTTPDWPSDARRGNLGLRHLLLLALGKHAAAWNALSAAIAIDPGQEDVLRNTVLHAAVTKTHFEDGDTAALQLAARDPDPLEWSLLGWYALIRHDSTLSTSVEAALRRPDTLFSTYDEAHRTGLHGLAALAAGDSAQGRRLLESAVAVRPWVETFAGSTVPDVPFVLALAKLELRAGALESAARRLYDAFLPEALPYRAEAEELRGQIAEQRGDTASAIRAYRNFVALWKDADPVLQPRVAAARAALARLER